MVARAELHTHARVRRGAAGASRLERSRAGVAAIQRVRLLAATVRTLDKVGYAETTVSRITDRARVSRRTFYELFDNVEECVAAALAEAFGEFERQLSTVDVAHLSWRERVRRGLWEILAFLDGEPSIAQIAVVQTLRGGPVLAAQREAILTRLAAALDAGRAEGTRGSQLTALTAEGLVGAGYQILHARLARGERRELRELYGELLGMILLPYLGPAATRREQQRPLPESPRRPVRNPRGRDLHGDPLEGVQMRLTYRTTRVLEGIAQDPGASNRRVADYAGIHDAGQVSRLLTRLAGLGLVANRGQHSKGEPNAWWLSAKGERVVQNIRVELGARAGVTA